MQVGSGSLQVWQVEACASVKCVLELVPDSYGLWPTVTTMASSDSRLRQTESHMTREACPQSGTCSNSYSSIDILNWVTTIIANRLQLSPGDVSLDTKLEEMVFVGGNCDSNFRTVNFSLLISTCRPLPLAPDCVYIDSVCRVQTHIYTCTKCACALLTEVTSVCELLGWISLPMA